MSLRQNVGPQRLTNLPKVTQHVRHSVRNRVFTLFPLYQAYFKTAPIIIILLPIALFEYQVPFLFRILYLYNLPLKLGPWSRWIEERVGPKLINNNKNCLETTSYGWSWIPRLWLTQCYSSSGLLSSPKKTALLPSVECEIPHTM